MSDKPNARTILTANQQTLNDLWEEHVRDEFATRDTEATLRTMVPDAYVNHVPVMTGGVGHSALREFYSRRFIPQMPPDTEIVPVSRTIGTDQLVDEMIFRFTHTMEMDAIAGGTADGQAGRNSRGGDCSFSRREVGARTYLLGSNFRTSATRDS
jgi:carboxymethylenebutenolidase